MYITPKLCILIYTLILHKKPTVLSLHFHHLQPANIEKNTLLPTAAVHIDTNNIQPNHHKQPYRTDTGGLDPPHTVNCHVK